MHEIYQNPLCTRYASHEMQHIFSEDRKFSCWRALWVALAEGERALGLPITEAQIEEMRAHIHDINYEVAEAKERQVRHDVMAHVHAYGEQCPTARGIIHLGATSCYVGDNTDIIVMREGLLRIRQLLLTLLKRLGEFAERHQEIPTLAYTHFQAAQPTTVGKRATLWMQELTMDLEQVQWQIDHLQLLGCKGTTGTCASFLELFDGDDAKVLALEEMIARHMGFDACVPVSGQTYSRKVDAQVLAVLSGIAQSASKFAHDIRLLSHLKEVDEPFESEQIGSSAMAYKRNPMRSERICALARHVIVLASNPALTAATQWLERTLDDSANRRIAIPESFLAADAILQLYINIVAGLRIYPEVMRRHLMEEMPFLATEPILMACVRHGGDRQVLHEAIRRHAVAAAEQVKMYGKPNDLLDRIAQDPAFGLPREALTALCDPVRFVGRASAQTEDYLQHVIDPLLAAHADIGAASAEIRV